MFKIFIYILFILLYHNKYNINKSFNKINEITIAIFLKIK